MTERALEVKKLLFGNQKQANVINDSVATIVGSYLDEHATAVPGAELYQIVYDLITELSKESSLSSDAELFIKLVCGEPSYNILCSGVPFIVTCDQPSTESPKYNFRITPLGEEAPSEPEASDALAISSKPTVGPDEVYNEDDSFAERARKIKDAILPMVPAGVKSEIPDNEYAQALCCAEYYYGYK